MTTTAHPLYPGKVFLKTAGGKNKACKCSRVLLWKDEGIGYKAVCHCGQVYWEWKPKETR